MTGPLPNTDESYPFNAANRQQKPFDLAKYGYVEEEYLISGYANVYEYHDVGLYPKIRCQDGSYCTRILVRRPRDPHKQSDFAILEILITPGRNAPLQAGDTAQNIYFPGEMYGWALPYGRTLLII